MQTLGILLFDGFELLDVFGPLEVLGHMKDEFRVLLVGRADCPPLEVLLVPGGIGTRAGVENAALLAWIREQADAASVVMTKAGTPVPSPCVRAVWRNSSRWSRTTVCSTAAGPARGR